MTGMSNICGESPRAGVVADEPQSDLQVSRGDSRTNRNMVLRRIKRTSWQKTAKFPKAIVTLMR